VSAARRGPAAAVGAAALVGALAGACAEVDGGPATVVSLGFDTSTVAVVVGDTLRDTLGAPLPLRASAFSATGDTIREPAVSIEYVVAPSDTTRATPAVRLAGPLVIGVRLSDTPARLFATAGGLQSLPKSVDVVRRPTRMLAVATRDSAAYLAASALSAGGGQVRVVADAADPATVVRRVAVRFDVERAAARVADSVLVVDERTPNFTGLAPFVPRSPLDTTDAQGLAGRRVLVFVRPGVTATDTVVLRATVAHPARFRAPGAAPGLASVLAADTVRIVVVVRPGPR
jgi:hypothetical protein